MQFFAPLIYQIISELPNIASDRLKDLQRAFAKQHKMETLPSKSQLLQTYFQLLEQKKLKKNPDLEQLLKKKAIRSMSGIVSVQVLTKPRPCPGQCIFCPNDPTMPKSYIKSEPGAMRAFLNQFDPIKQVYNRLQSLTLTGHTPEKIEMIVLGGSRDAYPEEYKTNFIKSLYDACNTFSELRIQSNAIATPLDSSHCPEGQKKKYGFTILNQEEIQLSTSLAEAIEKNQTAQHRIIGLTIETRPDLVTHENCQKWRTLGVTRIEMGVQTTDDEILQLNKRGHSIDTVKQAMHRMRQYGFKISMHLMPGLYGSSIEKDIQTFKEIFADPSFKPDELKVYPTSVIPNTQLYTLYQQGNYTPITTAEILQIIREAFQNIIPPYTRIKRLIRDIPATEISAGSSITNLSQLAHETMLREYKKALNTKVIASESRNITGEAKQSRNGMDCRVVSLRSTPRNDVVKFYSRLYENTDILKTEIINGEPDMLSYRHFVSLDTRSREVRNKKEQTLQRNLIIRTYESSVGTEKFISYEDELGYLYGFTRLLLPKPEHTVEFPGLGAGVAIIRELHIYGELQKIGESSETATQHSGLGKKLLAIAEQLAKKSDYHQLSIISGVGVRAYYFKNGYSLKGTYVSKSLISR